MQTYPGLRLLPKIRRLIRWRRRELAALTAALAVFAALRVLSPPTPQTSEVLVATHDLNAGTPLAASDVQTVPIPNEYLPHSALSEADSPLGRTLTANLTTGTVLTSAMVFSSQSSADEEKLVPLRFSDQAVVDLLKVGDIISVVATDQDGTSHQLASGVRVAALPNEQENTTFGSSTGALVVVATDAATATTLAAQAAVTTLGIVMG